MALFTVVEENDGTPEVVGALRTLIDGGPDKFISGIEGYLVGGGDATKVALTLALAKMFQRAWDYHENKCPLPALVEVLKKQAYFDQLTGAVSQCGFLDSLKSHMHSESVLLMLDIDKFKEVNDSYGHSAGDEVLRIVTLRMQNSVRKDDATVTVHRKGGDEFLLVLSPKRSKNITVEDVGKAAERIRLAVSGPIHVNDLDGKTAVLMVTVSIGASVMHVGEDLPSLFGRIDAAMYQSKKGGRNRVCVVQ